MFETFKNAWRIPELRKKMLYTLLMLFVFRMGSYIPVAGVNREFIGSVVTGGGILGLMDVITGGSLYNFTIFALGIGPYITASIVFQLLMVVIPKLEALSKEGEAGRKKITQYQRYAAIGLALVQGVVITYSMGAQAVVSNSFLNYFTIGLTLTAGSALTMWIGERISEFGIGNGVSLLIFIGIVSRLPTVVVSMIGGVAEGLVQFWVLPLVLVMALAVVVGVIYVDLGQRRVPVQYAKQMKGRKLYGGQSTHIPMKVNASGVLPIIFASSLLMFPQIILQMFFSQSAFYAWYEKYLGAGTVSYAIFFALLILFFTFLYTAISFKPTEIAKNMQQYGGFIPGIRPGKPTSDYLTRISNRLTLFGAIFLALLASVPMLFAGVGFNAFGATGVLIVVGVALETSKQLESQMLMRHYKGFLK